MEKRFLVYLEEMEDEGIDLSTLKKIKIEELYLSSNPSQKVIKEGDKCFLIGVFDNDPKKEITKEEYKKYTKYSVVKVVRKTRYFIPDSNGVISDLDIYERDELAILKLKSDDGNMFRPCWIGKEVTEDQRYKDDNLSFFGNPAKGAFVKGPGSIVYQVDIKANDIIFFVGRAVSDKSDFHQSLKAKIDLVYQEVFKYLIQKLGLLKFQNISDAVLTLDELLLLFDSKFVFEEDKNEFFAPIIHYFLDVIGEAQGAGISWIFDEEYLGKPFLDKGKYDFNCNQFAELLVNFKTPSIDVVRYILDFFQNHFLEEFNRILELKKTDQQ